MKTFYFSLDVMRFADAAHIEKKDAEKGNEDDAVIYGIYHMCIIIYSLQSHLSLFKGSTINFIVLGGISSLPTLKTLHRNDARRLL